MTGMDEMEWDESQREVIDSAPDTRLLVDAGPGTGKTAVACARVSQLIDQDGLEPSNILLISFTRTAVREIRDRIATYLNDANAAHAVKIATLDSYAWTIHSGFNSDVGLLKSYEENIEAVLDLVQEDDSVAEYLERIEHLVVDEAQDIVGIRADLVAEMVGKLSGSCGVTVFADEAQAIYGFADDRDITVGGNREPSFSEKIRCGEIDRFRDCELREIHRTDSPNLLRIFSGTRRKVLVPGDDTDDRLDGVKREVIRLADGIAPQIDPEIDDAALSDLGDSAFILYRRRSDVLMASSILGGNEIAHRVRMSGLPVCLAPWIGATLSEHEEPDLIRDRFMELWEGKVRGTSLATCEFDHAWQQLFRVAGRTETVVEMKKLRQRLGRKQPPAELCSPEIGVQGPIVGTIHACKGREADIVNLMLPRNTPTDDADEEEEARVVFVGATRGRQRLFTGAGYRGGAGRVERSGRVYRLFSGKRAGRVQFEIGCEGDIEAKGLAGREFYGTAATVRRNQDRIAGFADATAWLVAKSDRDVEFAYRLVEDGQEECLAVLSNGVRRDLWTIAEAVQCRIGGGNRRPPGLIPHLQVRGVRTIVLPPDVPENETLHDPWGTTGIMLAPVVLGYSTMFFPRRKN